MRRKKGRLKNSLSFWGIMYPASVFSGLLFLLLKSLGLIRVRGLERLSQNKGPVILVSNHPSLWEPLVLVCLFFFQYVFHPSKRIPWSTPDQGNYGNKWYWGGMFGSRFISVSRGDRRREYRALVEVVKVLRAGHVVILFPEGGRTGKGKEFVYSNSGNRMRVLKAGIGRIVCRVKSCAVIPVWVHNAERVLPIGKWFPRFWRGMTITVGEEVCFGFEEEFGKPESRKHDHGKVVERITEALLETADLVN